MPWAKPMFDDDGNLSAIGCKMCTKIKTQAKFINPKMGFSLKCVGKRKNEEGVRMMDLECAHAKNEATYVSMNHPSILQQVQGGNDQDNKKKVVHQFLCYLTK
jgi:hypothetical protein